MISETKLEANRRNAQCSTGPKTAAGKERSSRNNLRHGLTGHVNILPGEDRAAHDLFCEELIRSLQPASAVERQLAESVAEDSWRLNRARAIENNMFALGNPEQGGEVKRALAAAKLYQQQARRFDLLTIYEQRINRGIQRNLKLLRELQTERKAQHERAMAEAQLLAQFSLSNGVAYSPARDGFVFSNDEINSAIDRRNRLEAARHLAAAAGKPAFRPELGDAPLR